MFDLTLTFDNGPEPVVTAAVLDLLAERDIKATFFVVGHKLAAPGGLALTERAAAEGHWIGNHTWSHAEPLGNRTEAGVAQAEIERTQRLLGQSGLIGAGPLFRPTGGGGVIGPHLLNRECLDYLCAGGFTCVLWNSIPRDWAEPDGWVENAFEQCAVQPWTLMVLHDIASGAMRHLPRFIDAAIDRGARFRQDYPPDCLPVVKGRVVQPVQAYVTM
ncbi:MAG: polysaccharide deacetylase family protein [Dongiaceae bacterium]